MLGTPPAAGAGDLQGLQPTLLCLRKLALWKASAAFPLLKHSLPGQPPRPEAPLKDPPAERHHFHALP